MKKVRVAELDDKKIKKYRTTTKIYFEIEKQFAHGLVPRQHSTGARQSSTASANAAMCTCAACSFMALALCCCE